MCTECLMNGAMEIIESVESLGQLRSQLRLKAQIQIETAKCLGEPKHGEKSPLVAINGKLFEKASSETVMSHIISLSSKDVKR